MNVEITIGWWIFPLLITIAAMAWALLMPNKSYGGYGIDVMPLIRIAVAVITSLAAWLVWALLV